MRIRATLAKVCANKIVFVQLCHATCATQMLKIKFPAIYSNTEDYLPILRVDFLQKIAPQK